MNIADTLAHWNRCGPRAVNQGLILHLLATRGPHAAAALVEATGDTRQATDIAIRQMLRRGWIETNHRRLPGVPRTIKVVSITPAGKDAVGITSTQTP